MKFTTIDQLKKRGLVAGILTFLSPNSFSSAFLNFAGLSFSNPAQLSLVQKVQLILGEAYIDPDIVFTGTAIVPNPADGPNVMTFGSSPNTCKSAFTFGRIANRLTKQWVLGVDLSQPFQQQLKYPINSPARYIVTASKLNSYDISPNLAYTLGGKLSKLTLAAGVDALYFSATLNNRYPSLPSETVPFGAGFDNTFTNRATGWAPGWHAGFLFQMTTSTIIDLSYFSSMKPELNGRSTFTNFPDTKLRTSVNLPAVTNLTLTHFVNKKWTMILQAHYQQWNTLKEAILNNTAGPVSSILLPLNFKNSWQYDLINRYAFRENLAGTLLVGYDTTPTNDRDQNIGLPEADKIPLALRAEYNLSKSAILALEYAHVFFTKKVKINNFSPNKGPISLGNVTVAVNTIGLRLTINR